MMRLALRQRGFVTSRSLLAACAGTSAAALSSRRHLVLEGHEVVDVSPSQQPSASELMQLLSNGQNVCAASIAGADESFLLMHTMLDKQFNPSNYATLVEQHDAKAAILGGLVVKRAFWEYDDYSSKHDFRAHGVQGLLFDNYKWTIELSDQFKVYVEKWFPLKLHTHLRYSEYLTLMRRFRDSLLGFDARPALPKGMKLHPAYGVHVPTRAMLHGYRMYTEWLTNFQKVLGIRRALVVRTGCGVPAFQTCRAVRTVMATDPSSAAIESIREDARRFGASVVERLRLQVSDMFPSLVTDPGSDPKRSMPPKSFNLVTFAPALPLFDPDSGYLDYEFAPSLTGVRGDFEAFFEKVSDHMSDRGVIVVLTTNLHSLMEPTQPHPVEYELKANRRFMLLDYFDAPLKGVVTAETASGGTATSGDLTRGKVNNSKLRAELWVLHRIEAVAEFGWIHGIPGAVTPHGADRGALMRKRLKMIRQRVADSGHSWGEYQQRLVQMLQDSEDGTEDEVAIAVRMQLDPSFAEKLAEQTKRRILDRLSAEKQFHQRVAALETSPRDAYDRQATALSRSYGLVPPVAAATTTVASATAEGDNRAGVPTKPKKRKPGHKKGASVTKKVPEEMSS